MIDKSFSYVQRQKIFEFLSTFLPPKKITEEYIKETISKYIKFNNCVIDIENEEDYQEYTNSMKLYHKIKRCFLLADKYRGYDLYIRIRPDLVIEGAAQNFYEIYNDIHMKNTMYCCYSFVFDFYGFGVDDKLAIGERQTMQIYSETWDFSKQFLKGMAGHINLGENLYSRKIDVMGFKEHRFSLSHYNIDGKDSIDELLLNVASSIKNPDIS